MSSEVTRWVEFWKGLQLQAKAEAMPWPQYNAMRHLWYILSQKVKGLRKPSIEQSVSVPGNYYFSWSFTDIPHEVVTVDIDKVGQYDWYYWNSSDSSKTCEGVGDLNTLLTALVPGLKSFIKE